MEKPRNRRPSKKRGDSVCCLGAGGVPPSTCFDAEISDDGENIRCNFRHCPCGSPWVANESGPAAALARHVGEAVDTFVQRETASWPPTARQDVEATDEHCTLAVLLLELDDSRCTLASWLPPLLRAVFPAQPLRAHVAVVVRRFRSRRQLLERILLGDVHRTISHLKDGPGVFVVLSTHASSQGQVFSCTPSTVRDAHGFEEFCSLHDFAVACQRALPDKLFGIYVSSCFVMRLDRSHADWPVDAAWLRDGTLRTDVAGAASEVYYTGSQTADTFVVASAVARSLEKRIVPGRERLIPKIVARAQVDMIPGLSEEMGLRMLAAPHGRLADDDAAAAPGEDSASLLPDAPDSEPTVHPARRVMSNVEIVFVHTSEGAAAGAALTSALAENIRQRPDIDVAVKALSPSTVHELAEVSRRPLVVVVDSGDAAADADFLTPVFKLLADLPNTPRLYGVHFVIPNAERLRLVRERSRCLLCPVSAMLVETTPPFLWVPLVMYLVHLAAGENGRISAAVSTSHAQSPAAGPAPLIDTVTETPAPATAGSPGMPPKAAGDAVAASVAAIAATTPSPRPDAVMAPQSAASIPTTPEPNAGLILALPASPPSKARNWELVDVVTECRAVCPGLASRSNLVMLHCPPGGFLPELAVPVSVSAHKAVPHNTRKRRINFKAVAGFYEDVPDRSDKSAEPPKRRKSAGNEDDDMTAFFEADAAAAAVVVAATATSAAAVTAFPAPPSAAVPPAVAAAAADPGAGASIVVEAPSAPTTTPADEIEPDLSPLDLPLSANVKEIRVHSMEIHLEVDFATRTISGAIAYCIKELLPGVGKLVLDLSDITVDSVTTAQTNEPLEFFTRTHSLTIHKPRGSESFPEAVAVRYRTEPKGRSLLWCTDCEGRPCVFTCGSPLNNRSLMPCADAPTELVTYRARVVVPDGCVAIMSAPMLAAPEVVYVPGGPSKLAFSFNMRSALPTSTIAFAAGWFAFESISGLRVHATLWAPPSIIRRAQAEFAEPLARYFGIMEQLLGPFPFDRCDVAVMPRCFAALGLQNPNLTFVSQTLIAGDGSMCNRLAHELTHSYFGLLLGESDWSEQWLSEGFADYTSERIVLQSLSLSPADQEHRTRLASLLRYRTLINDLNNTEEFFHTLKQPERRASFTSSSSDPTQLLPSAPGPAPAPAPAPVPVPGPAPIPVIERCLEPSFHSIHYQKGYFLLRHLANMVGVDKFDGFLGDYVSHFRDKLLTGREALDFFFSKFPSFASETVNAQAICKEWVGSTAFPRSIDNAIRQLCQVPGEDNPLVRAVDEVLLKIYAVDEHLRRHGPLVRATDVLASCAEEANGSWTSDHMRLFLERLNEGHTVMHQTLELLDKSFAFGRRNADVRHSWCEVALSSKFTKAYDEVERLLVEDQAMGLFLFGELVSGGTRERAVAKRVWETVRRQQDPQTHAKMRAMIEDAHI